MAVVSTGERVMAMHTWDKSKKDDEDDVMQQKEVWVNL